MVQDNCVYLLSLKKKKKEKNKIKQKNCVLSTKSVQTRQDHCMDQMFGETFQQMRNGCLT